jgi:4-amino-4-deoxy-L-arabinose transferase-like glycosyltransferase
MGLRYVNPIKPKKLLSTAAAGLALLALLAAPFYWSLTTVLYVEQNSTLPYAGPELASSSLKMGGIPNQQPMTPVDNGTLALEKYLVANYKEGSYLVVSQRANDVAQFIVDTGLPAVAYGGFLGSDNAITLDRFKELVNEGRITYVLISGQGSFGGGSAGIASYVRQNAAAVSASEYLGSAQSDGNNNSGIGGATLYRFGG